MPNGRRDEKNVPDEPGREAASPSTRVESDLDHGGRWTSLWLAGRQWLWLRDDPARASVAPGDAFVDAGGLEECVPTIRGTPDHGAAWAQPWRRAGGDDVVECAEFQLRRRIDCLPEQIIASYRLSAEPGFRFIWAAHALLDLTTGARLSMPTGAKVRVYPEAAPHVADLLGGWPPNTPYLVGAWPDPFGVCLDALGPIDGTAIGAVVPDVRTATVTDAGNSIEMRLVACPDIPTAVALWRNLGGFGHPEPYRSIGVEPMLGRVFDLATAGPGDAVTVGDSGIVEWALHITSSGRGPGTRV